MSANEASWQLLQEIKAECFANTVKEQETDLPDETPTPRYQSHHTGPRKPVNRKIDKQPQPLPGELRLKEWVNNEAIRCGKHVTTIFMRLHRGQYHDQISIRRVSRYYQFVTVKAIDSSSVKE